MTIATLHREQIIRRPRAEVFAFFSDAANLERLTPPFLRFRIVTPSPIVMREGTLIDYRLSLFGVPFSWRTRIELVVPDIRLVDLQLRGPYKLWRHLHEFEDVDGGAATRMIDHVEYAPPLGVLGDAARVLFVRRIVNTIFDYRADTIDSLLPGFRGCISHLS